MSVIGSIADTIGRRDNLFPLHRAQWCHRDAQGPSVLYRAEIPLIMERGLVSEIFVRKKISRKLFERSRLAPRDHE